MKKINKNFIKRKIYKILPKRIRFKLLNFFLPEIKPELDGFIFRPAKTPEDYLSAFNLVYKVFLKTGFIQPSATPFRLAPQHCHPDSRVFIGTVPEYGVQRLVYSISVFPDSKNAGLPMDIVFKKELDVLREQGRFLVEAGHLAADQTYKQNTMNIPMLGNKILFQYACHHLDADDIVIAVHPRFQWLYEEFLLFEKLGEISQYSYANNNPAVALRLNLRTIKERSRKIYKNTSMNKNIYLFFFTLPSDSIYLPEGDTGIEKRLLENIQYLYGIK